MEVAVDDVGTKLVG